MFRRAAVIVGNISSLMLQANFTAWAGMLEDGMEEMHILISLLHRGTDIKTIYWRDNSPTKASQKVS